MAYELELVDAFLSMDHPESSGWVCSKNVKWMGSCMSHIFQKDGQPAVVALLCNAPVITKADVQQAADVLVLCKQYMFADDVRVMLVCGPLLVPPPNMPKEVSVMSIAEWTDNKPSFDAQLN